MVLNSSCVDLDISSIVSQIVFVSFHRFDKFITLLGVKVEIFVDTVIIIMEIL